METQHTPGPWKENGNYISVCCDPEMTIAGVFDDAMSIQEHEANRRLIAAAPDILYLLDESQKIIRGMGPVEVGSAAFEFLLAVEALLDGVK